MRKIIAVFSFFAVIMTGKGYCQVNSPDIKAAVYVWPSCHHDERIGDFLWPEGTGEWEIIKKGSGRNENRL
jgi:hypothetical protein